MFYASFYDAYKAAESIGKDREYTKALLEFAFEGKRPETENVILQALYSAFIPQIEANQKKREAGERGGRPKTKTNGS